MVITCTGQGNTFVIHHVAGQKPTLEDRVPGSPGQSPSRTVTVEGVLLSGGSGGDAMRFHFMSPESEDGKWRIEREIVLDFRDSDWSSYSGRDQYLKPFNRKIMVWEVASYAENYMLTCTKAE